MARHRFDRDAPEVALQPGDNHPLGALGGLFAPVEKAPVPFQRGSDTSEAAAEAILPDIRTLRRRVAELFATVRFRGLTPAQHQRLLARAGPAETPGTGTTGLTPDEAAWLLGLSVLTVRPRTSELVKAKTLEDAGERRTNDSGMRARVLRART
jgi:hypothetical protein